MRRQGSRGSLCFSGRTTLAGSLAFSETRRPFNDRNIHSTLAASPKANPFLRPAKHTSLIPRFSFLHALRLDSTSNEGEQSNETEPANEPEEKKADDEEPGATYDDDYPGPAPNLDIDLADAKGSSRAQKTFVSSHYQLGENEVLTFVERRKLASRQTPDHVILKYCPTCSDHKGKPDNLYKLYLSRSTGAFFCHRCGGKGSWFDFKRLYGEDSNVYKGSFNEAKPEKKFPDQHQVASYPAALFKDFPGVLKVLTGRDDKAKIKQRHLSEEVLKKYMVGAGKFMFKGDDDVWADQQCVTFPWIDVERDKGKERQVVKRVKIRSMREKRFQKLDPAGGGWGMFGWHTVGPDVKEIVLTEGEFDAMAVHQETGLPAVSLPNGAHSLPIELLPRLERFEKIYLWMDDDIPGQEGAAKFAAKLGLKRVWLVSTKDGDPQGPKDANDALIEGKDLKMLIAKAKRPSHSQVFTFNDIRQEVMRMISNPSQMAGVQCTTLPTFNKILKGHRKGELTVFTGNTGVGKTTFLSQLSLDLAQQGVNTLWGSFEVKNVNLIRKMLGQFANKDLAELEKDENALENMLENFAALPMYYMRFWGSTSVEQVLDAMEYAVYVHDVEHIILDNLQFILSGQTTLGKGQIMYGKYDLQDHALEAFRHFASTKNVHITLVIHPRKSDENVHLTNSSVFGSVKATQEADNVIMLQKSKTGKTLEITKNRFDGELGHFLIRFEKGSGRYVEVINAKVQAREAREEREKAAAAKSTTTSEKEAPKAKPSAPTTKPSAASSKPASKKKEEDEEEGEDEEEDEAEEVKPTIAKRSTPQKEADEEDEEEEEEEEEEIIRMDAKPTTKSNPPPSEQEKKAAAPKKSEAVATKPPAAKPKAPATPAAKEEGSKAKSSSQPQPPTSKKEAPSKAKEAPGKPKAAKEDEVKPTSKRVETPTPKKVPEAKKVERWDEDEGEDEVEEEEKTRPKKNAKAAAPVLTDLGDEDEEEEYIAQMGVTTTKPNASTTQKGAKKDADADEGDEENEDDEYLSYMKQPPAKAAKEESAEAKPKKKRRGLLG